MKKIFWPFFISLILLSIAPFQTQAQYIHSSAFSPDGKIIAIGGEKGLLQIWRGEGKLINTIKIEELDVYFLNRNDVMDVAISPDGLVIAALDNYHIYLYKIDGTLIAKNETSNYNGKLYFNQRGDTLMFVNENFTRYLFDSNGKKIDEFNFSPEKDLPVDKKYGCNSGGSVLLRNGNYLITYSIKMFKRRDIWENYVVEYDSKNNLVRKTKIEANPEISYGVRFTYNSKNNIVFFHTIYTSNNGKTTVDAFVYNVLTGQIKRVLGLDSFNVLNLMPDGDSLISFDYNKIVYTSLSGGQTTKIKETFSSLGKTFFSPDYKKVIVSDRNVPPVLYSIKSEKLFVFDNPKVIIGKELASNSLTQSQNSIINTVTPYIDPSLLSTPDAIEMTLQNAHNDEINNLAYSPDGKLLASASKDGTVKIWNRKGMILHTLQESGPVYALAFSSDGKTIVTARQDINIWSLGGTLIRTIKNHNKLIGGIALDPNGKYIATCSASESFLTLWGADSLPIRKFVGHSTSGVNRVAFSPDGKTLISAAGDMFKPTDDGIILWSIDGTIIKKIPATPAYIRTLNFSSDGTYFASAFGNEIRIWDKSGNPYRTISIDKNSSVYTVAFSPDNKRIAAGGYDGSVMVFDINGNKLNTFLPKNGYVNAVAFSPDGQSVVSGQTGRKIIEWSFNGNNPISYEGANNVLYNIALSTDGKTIISGQNYKLVKWDFEGRMIKSNPFEWGVLSNGANSPDGKWIVIGQKENISIYNSKGELIKKITPAHIQYVNQIVFTPDSKYFISCSGDGQIKIWNYDGTLIRTIVGNSNYDAIDAIAVSPDNSYIAALSPQYIKLWNFNGKLLSTLDRPDDGDKDIIRMDVPSIVSISPDNNLIAGFFTRKQIVLWDRNGNFVKAINPLPNEGRFTSLSFSPNSQLLVTGMQRNPIHIFSVDGTLKKTLLGHTGNIVGTLFTKDGNSIVSGSKDGTVRIWDIESGNSSIMYALGEEYLVYTPDGYWDGSKNCGSLIPMVKGTAFFGIDQFALKYNRPDIILQRIKQGTPDLIKHYQNQHNKRLKKSGFTEDQLSGEMILPESKIVDVKQNGKFADVSFILKDSLYSLKKYNVFVNDVPLFGAYGKSITGKTQSLTEKVEFTQGKNKIEISCMNDKGSESFRALAYADYNEQAKGDLYFLAFGVSKYQNPAYNLAYADKDAKDLTTIIDGLKGKGYANVYTKILVNEQVTPDAIKASKDFTKNAKPDDTFILFIAGHGMHDKNAEATYYYLTSNADINNLKSTAADFETIEDLLQGIPPRNKLFLMDACESGEIDDEEQGQMLTAATGVGISSRGFKKLATEAVSTSSTSPKRTYLYQKDRYIYNDLARRSGAIVFSSSKGGEFSYERSDIENGLFTENIMKALTTTEADKNGDGIISTDELRDYVSAQVAKASGDLQHPTVDRDNIYQKFGFGVK